MKRRLLLPTSIVLVFGLFVAVQGLAEVYKWKDSTGKIHYGDRPPVDSQNEKLELDIEDKGVYQSSGDYKRRQEKLLGVFEEERKIREEEKAKVKEQQAEAKIACDRAKKYEDRYARANLLYEEMPDGTRVFMSDDDRDKVENELQTFLKKNCSKK